MDLSVIKQKLQANQSKPKAKAEKIDYAKVFWKPKIGKHQIRIVPSKLDKQNPFREIYLHYGFAKFPIFALTNWGEQDPIVDFAKDLRKSKDKDDWALASKVSPKMRVFMPVLVRGEEHMGTRLWEVGKTIYMELMKVADDEDYGDFTNILEGTDFTVEATETVVAGRKGITCSIRPKKKTSLLTEDKDLLEKLLNDQPDVLELNERYKHTYESLKEVLQKWLHEGNEGAEDEVINTVADANTIIESEVDDDADLPILEKVEIAPAKKSKSDKFNKLFKED